MRWPWSKELDKARSEARGAAEEHAYSTQHRIEAEQEKRAATRVTRQLRHELDRNGWTELLQESMGGAR